MRQEMTERYSSSALDRVQRAYKGGRLNQVCPGDLRQAREDLAALPYFDNVGFLLLFSALNRLLRSKDEKDTKKAKAAFIARD